MLDTCFQNPHSSLNTCRNTCSRCSIHSPSSRACNPHHQCRGAQSRCHMQGERPAWRGVLVFARAALLRTTRNQQSQSETSWPVQWGKSRDTWTRSPHPRQDPTNHHDPRISRAFVVSVTVSVNRTLWWKPQTRSRHPRQNQAVVGGSRTLCWTSRQVRPRAPNNQSRHAGASLQPAPGLVPLRN